MKQIDWRSTSHYKKYYLLFTIVILILVILLPYSEEPIVADEKEVTTFNINRVALKANQGLAKRFFKIVEFSVMEKPEQVIYGNAEIGYFSTKNFQYNDGVLTLELLPPSFRKPIYFYVGSKQAFVKHFSPEKSQLLKAFNFQQLGSFHAPFYLITGMLHVGISDDFERAVFPMLINKFGEVIWAHVPEKGNRNFKKYLTSYFIGKNKIANLYSEQSSYFEVIDLKGNVLTEFSGKKQGTPMVIHHDFHWNELDKSLITFSNEMGFFRPFHINRSWAQNFWDIIKTPISFVSSSIIKLDINKLEYDTLNLGFDMQPLFSGHLTDLITSFLNPIKAKVWATWGERVQYDHLHANAIQKTNEGWLVSYRNVSKVVMYDDSFQNELWSLGTYPDNTYTPLDQRHAFYHQHHVSMLPNGDLLMMDNHPSPPAKAFIGSRILKLRRGINGTFHVVWNYQPEHLLASRTRGSAYQLRNQNILAFYPESEVGADQILEIDYATGKPTGQISISFYEIKKKISKAQGEFFSKKGVLIPDKAQVGGGNRAQPIYDIGHFTYIGMKRDKN